MTDKKKTTKKAVKYVKGRFVEIPDNKNIISRTNHSKYYFYNRKSIESFIELEVEPRPQKDYEFDKNKLLVWFIGKYLK